MLIYILCSVFLGVAGQILFKLGAKQLFAGNNMVANILGIFTNVPVMSGLFLYAVSTLLWIKILSKSELSYVYPMLSLGYILIMVFSFLIFHEHISMTRILGTVLIVAGVVMVARS